MSGYNRYLGEAFPWVVDLTPEDAQKVVDFLVGQEFVSSFAVTAEPDGKLRRVYLSQVSMTRLNRQGWGRLVAASTEQGE